jgi:hypothetical protein
MKRFYADFDTINAFTLSLDFHQNELECVHCSKHDQFVSHGIIVKQRSSTLTEKVGKRIFCSNRYGRTGCGRTFQLYVANEIPHFRYGAAHLFVFISSLLANMNIFDAYYQATGQTETRNAWRWLSRLMKQLSEYRSYLKFRTNSHFHPIHSSSQYLKHLLPIFPQLFSANTNACIDYQLNQQRAFF